MLISSVVGSVGVSLSSFVSSRRTIRINYSPNQWGEEEWKTPFTENSINGWTDYGSQGGKLPKWTLKLLRFHGHISDILWSHETHHGIGVSPSKVILVICVVRIRYYSHNTVAETAQPKPINPFQLSLMTQGEGLWLRPTIGWIRPNSNPYFDMRESSSRAQIWLNSIMCCN